MTQSSALKGAIFEWFVKNLLKSCGFIEVEPDNHIVYPGTMGLMIHGLGQAHNADILMIPPFQIPFYFPSRLLVECKAYGEDIGLPILRGVLGLREDINNFDIVTPEILDKRKNYRRNQPAVYPYKRFTYQVALASLTNIKQTAFEFAQTHRIPIISFHSSNRYKFLRNFIENITDEFCQTLADDYDDVLAYLKNKEYNPSFLDNESYSYLIKFIDQSKKFFTHTYVGVLQDGNIIFMTGPKVDFKLNKLEYDSEIHWSSIVSDWWLTFKDNQKEMRLYFELPLDTYEEWEKSGFDRKKAIEMKEKEFKNIFVYTKNNEDRLIFFVLNLDMNFIRRAKELKRLQ